MNCIFCHAEILAGHKVIQVFRFHGSYQYGVPCAVGEPEAAHLDCQHPARGFNYQVIPPKALVAYNPGMSPRVAPSHQCLYCGETFRANDRLIEIIRAEGVAVDPQTGAKGILCADDREYSHARCDDRDATKGTHRTLVVLA